MSANKLRKFISKSTEPPSGQRSYVPVVLSDSKGNWLKRFLFHLLMCVELVLQTASNIRASETRNYILQDEHECDVAICGARTEYLPVDEEIVIFGGNLAKHSSVVHQHDDCNSGLVCELQLFPDTSDNNKQQLHLIFVKFSITSDEIQLKLDQASTTSFKDVYPIATLTKNSPRPEDYMTDVGNVLRIRLTEGNSSDGYGFQISITRAGASLTPQSPSSDDPVSPGVIALISFIAVAVVSFIVYIVVKTIILKRRMKSFERNSRESLTGLTLRDGGPGNQRRTEANTYTPIPTESGSNPETQRQRSEDSNYVMTDFPYANTPIVLVKSSESSRPLPTAPPPAYDDAVRMSYD